jgi:hypothetical protein
MKMDDPSKHHYIFNELHNVISQKKGLLMSTAVGTSNPKYYYLLGCDAVVVY